MYIITNFLSLLHCCTADILTCYITSLLQYYTTNTLSVFCSVLELIISIFEYFRYLFKLIYEAF